MKIDDVFFILDQCQRRWPSKFERLSAIYPARMVMMKFIIDHTKELVSIIKVRFEQSEEYREACEYISMLADDTLR